MQNPLPSIDDFIDGEITEADFKIALTKLHLYLQEAVGENAENITAEVAVKNSGSGNAVTAIKASGSTLTVTKGTSFVPASRTINGKALTDNITLTAGELSGLFPDFSSATVIGEGNTLNPLTFTAPANGYFISSSLGNNTSFYIGNIRVGAGSVHGGSGWSDGLSNTFVPMKKGKTIRSTGEVRDVYAYFIPVD